MHSALVDQFRGHHYEHLFLFLLATGARLGEARGLRWHDFDGTPLVDLEQGVVTLGQNTVITLKKEFRTAKGRSWDWKRLSKADRVVTVHLAAQALAALRAQSTRIKALRLESGPLWQDHDLVFPSSVGTPFDDSNVWKVLQRMCKAAGVPPLPVHATRHTSATNDLRAGTDPRVVMAKHGWSQERMLRRYQHVDGELLRQAAERAEPVLPRTYLDGATG
jgi:integrase